MATEAHARAHAMERLVRATGGASPEAHTMSAPLTRGRAIAAMCKDCIFDSTSPGNWRQQVSACTSPGCPLFAFRPVSRPKDSQEPSTRRPASQGSDLAGNGEALGGQP